MDYNYSRQVGYAAMLDDNAVCWWCGRRLERFVGDHICALLEDMPVAAACWSCNQKRQRRLPTAEAMQRLLFADNVVRDRSAAETKLAIENASRRLFGSVFWCGLVVALTRKRAPVYRSSSKGLSDKGVYCETSNRKLREAGLL